MQSNRIVHRLVVYLDDALYQAFVAAATEEQMSLADAADAAFDGWVFGDDDDDEEEEEEDDDDDEEDDGA